MSDISTKLYNGADEIMERFDFHKVRSVMVFLNWTWAGMGIPSIEELKRTAHHVLFEAIAEYERKGCPDTGMDCSTGGFVASISVFASGTREINLLFYVDQAYVQIK
jgi:hypothetical protein